LTKNRFGVYLSCHDYIVIYDQIPPVYIFTLEIIIGTGGFTLVGIRERGKSVLYLSIF
jgi:hypothetical protein